VSYWNVLDLPIDPAAERTVLGPLLGKIFDESDGGVLQLHHSTQPRSWTLTPVLAAFDTTGLPRTPGSILTSIAWPASYNAAVPAIMRTPPTPCVANFGDNIMCTQGQSYILDRTLSTIFRQA